MNEAAMLFYEDLTEKQSINRSAYSRAKSAKVPMNHYTKKEIEAMNGDVKQFDLTKPMSWKAFQTMGADLQREYLEKLIEKGVTSGMMRELFGVSQLTIIRKRKELGVQATHKEQPKKEAMERFHKWLQENGQDGQEQAETVVGTEACAEDILTDDSACSTSAESDQDILPKISGQFTVVGRFSEIYPAILTLVGDDVRKFDIYFSRAKI